MCSRRPGPLPQPRCPGRRGSGSGGDPLGLTHQPSAQGGPVGTSDPAATPTCVSATCPLPVVGEAGSGMQHLEVRFREEANVGDLDVSSPRRSGASAVSHQYLWLFRHETSHATGWPGNTRLPPRVLRRLGGTRRARLGERPGRGPSARPAGPGRRLCQGGSERLAPLPSLDCRCSWASCSGSSFTAASPRPP